MSECIEARFDWNGSEDLLARFHLQTGGLVQLAISNAAVRYMAPYTPMDSGALMNSAQIQDGGKTIYYPGPYAHYQYYGQVYGPNIPIFEDDSGVPTRYVSPPKKYPTGRSLQYQKKNPMAGPFWFERMKANHTEDILREAVAVATGG